MQIKKIDVPNKVYHLRDKLKKEHNIVGDFKRFDIVYVEHDSESYIGVVDDTFHDGYKVVHITENGQICSSGFTANAKAKITLVERQNPIEVIKEKIYETI